MKALVFHGPRDIRYESAPDPELATPNSAIIEVEGCSICGSDLHIYHGDRIGKTDYADAPTFCVGHEFIGEVVDTGPDCKLFKIGDRVLSAGGTGCGRCASCLAGQPLKCPRATAFGIGPGLPGGQAELVNVPNADATLMRMDGISDAHALLLTDALATAFFGITRAEVQPGGSVAVVGLGPIGVLGVELAFLLGAAEVFAVDPVPERRARAEALGATAFPPDSAVAGIREATSGLGAGSVFEASGHPTAVASLAPLVAPGGTVSCVGLPPPGVGVPLAPLLYKNVTLRGGICPVQEMWPALVPLLQSGRLKAEGLFSHHMPLADGAEAYRLFEARESFKLHLTP